MKHPTEWATAAIAVAAIYSLTGWALGPRRRHDPVLWIGSSMAGVLLIGGLVDRVLGERADVWQVAAGIALGAWAWRRWRRTAIEAPRASHTDA